MSFTGGNNQLPMPGGPPPWFGSPVQQQAQFPHVQPPQIPQFQQPQAQQPQAQQPEAQTPYQRMMQGNGLQQFQNNMQGATPQQQPQPQQAQQPNPGLISLLASKLGGMLGGGGSLNGQPSPQAQTNAANANGIY